VKIGLLLTLYRDLGFEAALDKAVGHGVESVELGAGNYADPTHLVPERVIADADHATAVVAAVERRGLSISALSVHGNPVHPDPAIATAHDATFRQACRAAELLDVHIVNVFSGCPGDRTGGTTPNWVTCPWPREFSDLYEWQWSDVLIPYWTEASRIAMNHGVRLGFEMHPGMSVYNPATLLRLRDAAGPAVGCNLDPSHLVWQGIDVPEAVRALGSHDCLFHVHAKDTLVDRANIARNGNIDPRPYSEIKDRAWTFRTVGFGHGESFWRRLVSELRLAGYDGALSIEHEDPLSSVEEGLTRAVEILQRSIFRDPPAAPWWMD
jgi:sugar phosphate isomerase/epimerase